MSDLNLDSFQIQNFRAFRDLTIERLGRVNLIVGKNNVGKTALLEALWVWAHDEYWDDLTDELVKPGVEEERSTSERLRERYEAIRHLFYGRPGPESWGSQRSDLDNPEESEIYLGPCDDRDYSKGVYLHVNAETGSRIQWFRMEAARWHPGKEEFRPVGTLGIKSGSGPRGRYDLQPIDALFVSSSSLNETEQSELWSNAVRDGKKSSVLSLLKAIDCGVEDVNLIQQPFLRGHPHGNSIRFGERSVEDRRFVVTREASPKPISLESLGEGMVRAMSIGLGLVGGEGGMTLIDEIENGIHYSAQPGIWRMIFRMAKKLDVQVFATTHSYDCVQAFQKASQEHNRSESMLVSLRRREEDPDDIVAIRSDRDELSTVVEEDIEVR
jgi:predicted ATPase